MRKLLNRKNGKSGFTLIEIIAVLVIIGILAVVGVTKSMNLITEAQQKALSGAVCAGTSQCSLSYGKLSLQLGRTPTAADVLSDVLLYPPACDFTIGFELAAGGVNVTVADPASGLFTNKVWITP